jgi:Trypsin-like peptidase domain
MMSVEHLSLVTTPIILRSGDNPVSQGTGFLFIKQYSEKQKLLFLVTNYHVLTGSAPNENQSPIGDNIEFSIHENPENPSLLRRLSFPLFTKHGNPIWVTHPTVKEADLAVIPIPADLVEGFKINCITEDWITGTNMIVRAGTPITLIGYPYGFYDRANELPIWKTGNIASEPNIDFEGKPLFMVDVSAFPGMSGSPAVAIAYGAFQRDDGHRIVGNARRFLGIFASIQMRNERKYLEEFSHASTFGITTSESLQLGHIWKAPLILDIINSIDLQKYAQDILNDF